MACNLAPSERDLLVRLFRRQVYEHTGFVEFTHQAEMRLATEGLELTSQAVDAPPKSLSLNPKADHRLKDIPVQMLQICQKSDPGAFSVGETGNWARVEWRLAKVRKQGIAHQATDLQQFKAGKSKGVGMWATGFACLPGATIDMIGLEYSTSEHEFDYLCEALLSGTTPVVAKSQVKHYHNDVRQGRMYLELRNGCSYAVRSYKNKDTLRGGQITAYIFNEIYQLPGLEVYTGNAQNLRAEKGFSYFTSTPDRPWVKVLHTLGHGRNPDWHCTCEGGAFINPLTFSLPAFMQDAPDWETIAEFAPDMLRMARQSGLEPGSLMSREKFKIAWLGKLGGFAGSVYAINKAKQEVDPGSFPQIFKRPVVEAWKDRSAYLEALHADAG